MTISRQGAITLPLTENSIRALGDVGRFEVEQFTELFRLKESTGKPCVRRLLGKPCGRYHNYRRYGVAPCDCNRWWMDHPYTFYRPGDKRQAIVALAWFPYHFESEEAQSLLLWTRPRGLGATVLPRGTGWYGGSPSLQTFMVMVWRSWPLSELRERVNLTAIPWHRESLVYQGHTRGGDNKLYVNQEEAVGEVVRGCGEISKKVSGSKSRLTR